MRAPFLPALVAIAVCAGAWDMAMAAAIRGVIANPERCAGVSAILRGGTVTRLKVRETKGRFDPKSGKFKVSGLKDGAYDLRVHLKQGGRIDGASMTLTEDEASDQKMTDEDRRLIQELVDNFPVSFCDVFRLIRIEGNGEFARVLVEKIRHRDFHSGKRGGIVWRMEVWKFECHTGAWVKSQHGWYVLARERIPRTMKHEVFRNLRWGFDPKLAGFRIAQGRSPKPVRYTIPAKVGMSMGKAPGSVHKQIKIDREKRKKKQEEDGLE